MRGVSRSRLQAAAASLSSAGRPWPGAVFAQVPSAFVTESPAGHTVGFHSEYENPFLDIRLGEVFPVRPFSSPIPETCRACPLQDQERHLQWPLNDLKPQQKPTPTPPFLSRSASSRWSGTDQVHRGMAFSTAAAELAPDDVLLEDSPTPAASTTNQGVLVQLGIIPPYDPLAEEEAKEKEVIMAYRRSASGKISASKERRSGRVPSVLFEQAGGHLEGNKELIAVEAKQIAALLKRYGRASFLSRSYKMHIVHLDDSGAVVGEAVEEHRVLPKSVHEHCSKNTLLNVTFLKKPHNAPGARVKLEVPLQFIGEDACPGIRKGGWLFCMRRVVPLECSWDSIPPNIQVDLSTLNVGKILLLSDLKLGPSCKLLIKNHKLPVCKIAGSRSLEAATD